MKNTYRLLSMALLAVASGSTYALESATTGSQATQATVGVINSKVDTTNAIMNNVLACNAVHKFYAPSDPKKDATGCVGVGDYDLNMASTNNINFVGGQVLSTGSSNGNYLGRFNNTATAGYGVYGQGVNGYGVYGLSSANWGGVFVGSSGVLGEGSAGWSVEGSGGPYGVYGSGSIYGGYFDGNVNINGLLCIHGACVSSLSGGRSWGGSYEVQGGGACFLGNPYTGGCSCLGGYGGYTSHSANDRTGTWYSQVTCYQ